MQGRIGDSPLIGCGGYANEHGGCSTTGHGESLMKMTLAREAVYNIEKDHNAQVILTIISHFMGLHFNVHSSFQRLKLRRNHHLFWLPLICFVIYILRPV